MAYGGDGEVAVASERRRLVLKPRDPDAAARADAVRAASAKSVSSFPGLNLHLCARFLLDADRGEPRSWERCTNCFANSK
jgi:hypothetical protein